MAAPLISIVTPAFDVAPFIGDAVASARAQSLTRWEMVIVDDGSRDGTALAAERAAEGDPRIRILRQANAGVSAARMAGIGAAAGGALLFLDADDWLAPDALARLSAALDGAPGAVAAYGPWAAVAEGARPGDPPLRLKPGPYPAGDILKRLLVENLLANGGHLLARRAAFEAAGGFRPSLRYGEDWECWIRLALAGPFATVEGREPLLHVRERGGSAYRRMARDPAAFAPAMAAIWENPALADRLGPATAARIRRRAQAENDWVVGKELLRHGARAEGLRVLRASALAAPSLKRLALLAAAHSLPALPARLHGPFARYPEARGA
ncbi:glycosyltransferase family 2 protein [Falsiroseomonas ponticola]|uniref:glycosyltransferase family 2 protein n=1 Tax=Falsiroseomonas ponticola TaxID=2786951 RepID=UPI001934847F|nr:glycosyltransferase family A protein [Roseomonas ponticola]